MGEGSLAYLVHRFPDRLVRSLHPHQQRSSRSRHLLDKRGVSAKRPSSQPARSLLRPVRRAVTVADPVPDPTLDPADETASEATEVVGGGNRDTLDGGSADDVNTLKNVQQQLRIAPRVLTIWECFVWINKHMWANIRTHYLASVNIAWSSIWAIYQPIIMGEDRSASKLEGVDKRICRSSLYLSRSQVTSSTRRAQWRRIRVSQRGRSTTISSRTS